MIAAQAAEPADLADSVAGQAAKVLARARRLGVALVTAESCTGGLVSALLTDIEGLSGAFERGFAVYSNAAKQTMLGIDASLIASFGAVSREVATAMAAGALAHSEGHLAVAITGFAGPAGKFDEEGLVYLAGKSKQGHAIQRECHVGAVGRDRVRELATRGALEIFGELLDLWRPEQGRL